MADPNSLSILSLFARDTGKVVSHRTSAYGLASLDQLHGLLTNTYRGGVRFVFADPGDRQFEDFARVWNFDGCVIRQVEEKFPQEKFRVLSEMRFLAKIRLGILDFVGYVANFSEIWREI